MFLAHYPVLYEHFSNENVTQQKQQHPDWPELCRQRLHCRRACRKALTKFSERNHLCENLSYGAFREIDQDVISIYGMEMVLDAVTYPPMSEECLTLEYYRDKCESHYKRIRIRKSLLDIMSRSSPEPKHRIYLDGMIAFSQLMQLSSYKADPNYVRKQLDEVILPAILETIRIQHEDHPVLDADLEELSAAELKEDRWNDVDSERILDCMNLVLFHQLGFTGYRGDTTNVRTSYIEEVVRSKMGIPITLSLIYLICAHRLGVHLEPLAYMPRRFMLLWKAHPSLNYVDPYEYGKRRNRQQVEEVIRAPLSDNNVQPSPTSAVSLEIYSFNTPQFVFVFSC